MNDWLMGLLACPRHGEALADDGAQLSCARGHRYPIVDGIPVLLRDDVEQTGWWSHQSLAKAGAVGAGKNLEPSQTTTGEGRRVQKHVQEAIAATCGNLYSPLIGKLCAYPIPELRLPEGNGKTLLDIGCNWGRWSIAASRKGYRVIGMDPNLDAVLAAREVAKDLGASCSFIVCDARYLPFRRGSLDVIFSYSVIQHFSKQDARCSTLACIAAALHGNGYSLIQMPNKFGLRSAYHLARRRFSEGTNFDVRYWSPGELKRTFEEIIGPTHLSVDGFFGLGIQPSDIALLPARFRLIVRASEVLRRCSQGLPFLLNVADSLYAKSRPG